MRERAASNAMLEARRGATNREFYQQLSIRPTNRLNAALGIRICEQTARHCSGRHVYVFSRL
jgi:hypothetical protein